MEPEWRRHCFQPIKALRARSQRQACPRNILQESSQFLIYEWRRLIRRFMPERKGLESVGSIRLFLCSPPKEQQRHRGCVSIVTYRRSFAPPLTRRL